MKSTSPAEYATLLPVLAEGLRKDLFTKEEATQWADYFIVQDEQPDIFFVDLALSRTKEEAIALLHEAARSSSAQVMPRPLLAACYKKLLADNTRLKHLASSLWSSAWEGLLTEQECYFMDALAYAAETIELTSDSTRQQFEQDTLAFLSLYQDYTLANYAYWPALDRSITHTLSDLKLLHLTTVPQWWPFRNV